MSWKTPSLEKALCNRTFLRPEKQTPRRGTIGFQIIGLSTLIYNSWMTDLYKTKSAYQPLHFSKQKSHQCYMEQLDFYMHVTMYSNSHLVHYPNDSGQLFYSTAGYSSNFQYKGYSFIYTRFNELNKLKNETSVL